MSRWIYCSDRLPEKTKDVLLFTIWGTYDVGYHFAKGDYWGSNCSSGYRDKDVIAWMELPEGPRM